MYAMKTIISLILVALAMLAVPVAPKRTKGFKRGWLCFAEPRADIREIRQLLYKTVVETEKHE